MFLIPWGNHVQLGAGSVAERLRITLAYSWVECCSDRASCETTSSFKISILCCVISVMYLLMNERIMLNGYE